MPPHTVDQVLHCLRAWIDSGTARAEILAATGLSAPTLSRYLSGERRPSDEAARELEKKIPARYFPRALEVERGRPKVFVSSTFLDNAARRKVVEDAILRAGAAPLNMERWTASERPVLSHCLDQLSEADVLVGILAYRYGFVPDGEELSITELEFQFAEKRGIDRLMFLIDDHNVPRRNEDLDQGADRWSKQEALDRFKERIARSGCTPVAFDDERLGMQVLQALMQWTTRRRPQTSQNPSGPSMDAASAVLAPYYDRLIAELGQIRIAGFVTPIRGRLDLASVYVPLGLAHAQGTSLDEVGRTMRGHTGQYGLRQARGKQRAFDAELLETDVSDHERPITMASALCELFETGSPMRIVVLLGHPGAGKTTFQKQIAVLLAQDGPASLGLPGNVVPVFIELRALQDSHQSLEDLIEARLNALAPQLGPNLLGALKSRRLLLLLDGLDEVPNARRQEVRGWIETYAGPTSPHRAILTCRFMGYTDEARFPEGDSVQVLEVLPLRTEQRDRLIKNWYTAVELSEAGSPQPRTNGHARAETMARERSASLIQSLEDGRATPLYELSVNPLLLSALCVIHRDRKTQLPERRVDLYRECVDGLLELWRKRQDLPWNLSLTARQARQVLEPVALWMHGEEGRTRGNINDRAKDGFVDTLGQALRKALVSPDLTPDGFLTTIRDESGLITGLSGEDYGFVHLRFQEYLASCELRRSLLRCAGNAEQFAEAVDAALVQRFHQSWWKEVVASLFADPESEPLFRPFHARMLREVLDASRREQYKNLIGDTPYFDPTPFVELLTAAPRASKDQLDLATEILRVRAPEVLLSIPGRLGVDSPAGLAAPRSAGRASPAGDRRDAVTGLVFAPIPAGEFSMGSPKAEQGRFDDEWKPHRVRMSAFEMATTPVTNAQYGRYLAEAKGVEPPRFWGDERFNQPDQPVVGVSWDDTVAYCRWAESKLGDGSRIRLPSEAEWEYACRAGTQTRFWSGDTHEELAEVGWFDKNSGSALHTVAEKRPNAFGLHDMHGNVFEWCLDWWCDAGSKHASTVSAGHPTPCGEKRKSDPFRVVRGGSFGYGARLARSASRIGGPPGYRFTYLGFRPVRITP